MTGDLVLGLDCSTTAAKAVVWTLTGQSVSIGRASYGHSAPKPGWGEQDPPLQRSTMPFLGETFHWAVS